MPEDSHKAELLEQAKAHLFRSSKDFGEPIIAHGRGATVVDTDEKEYFDFGSGQMAASIGHNHPAITEALRRSSDRILHLNTNFVSEEVVGLMQGYHGHTGGAMSVTFSNRRGGYGPWVPGGIAIPTPYCYRCPLNLTFPSCDYACARLGFDMVEAQSTGSLAAFIAEPILSAAGILEPPPGYFPLVKQMCEERGMLFILDEAQTGMGRVGATFAFEQDDFVPDILALSKTLGAGLPLSAMITSKEIEETCHDKGMAFISSHQNDPFAAAVGLAVIEVLVTEGLADEARAKGQYLKDAYMSMKEDHPIIGDVRGRGLLLGMELVKDPETKEPAGEETQKLTKKCLENGLILQQASYASSANVWRIAPPMTATYEELDRGVEILDRSMTELGM
ncbi:MAG: aminotransferase class III-fold pyridoxal phosphate-dependent enzyme [Dehalococcoidia bacterium]|nr:aminotransferase class III-fold pyridoxal phosphate-dependent enzyme [Dehalococcoidia bacterium]